MDATTWFNHYVQKKMLEQPKEVTTKMAVAGHYISLDPVVPQAYQHMLSRFTPKIQRDAKRIICIINNLLVQAIPELDQALLISIWTEYLQVTKRLNEQEMVYDFLQYFNTHLTTPVPAYANAQINANQLTAQQQQHYSTVIETYEQLAGKALECQDRGADERAIACWQRFFTQDATPLQASKGN
ncbi:hypothetical protein [Loigolactobacillus jiayinensis]|uniref:Uncharacterized protein n=1 Tax=Loigolactobacillus jiayinensis TaxID=2486016 RepID=A0ABW1REL7_9LACO|nr:hypothetical protein [Loigolactobacillus jiayinensis]